MNPTAIPLRFPAISVVLGLSSLAPSVLADPGWSVEKFTGISGSQVSDLAASATCYGASETSTITRSVLPANTGDNYGSRVRGYITAPADGLYTFWESGDDAVQFFLSPDDNPANKQLIAYHTGSTSTREWGKYPTQKSFQIPLAAGKRYYVEVLHKEGGGADHAGVAWSFNDPQPGAWYLAGSEAASSRIFAGLDLASVGSIVGTMNGAWIGSARDAQVEFLSHTGTQLTCQLQFFDGTYTKVTKIVLSQNGNDIHGYQVYAKYRSGNWLGQDFDTMGTSAPIGAGGYGVDSLSLSSSSGTLLAAKRALIPLSVMETYSPAASATPAGLTRETYTAIPGGAIADLTNSPLFQGFPSSTTIQADGLAPSNAGDAFGVRLRGTITPQVSGDYTFWESGDDEVQFFLSPTENPADKQLIASHTGWTGAQQWEQKTSQKSRTLTLAAGKSYYIEVLHKDTGGADHLAIAWTPPGGTREIIPSTVLNSYAAPAADLDDDGIADAAESTLGLNPADRADAAADSDGDGIPNRVEYSHFANPAVLNEVSGALTDEIWFNLPGDKLYTSVYKATALRDADLRRYVTTTQAFDVGEGFARRIRGYIVAPVTGSYQFWGTADDDVDLFLSTSSSKLQLRQIIRNNVLGWGTNFDIDPSQKSAPVTLTTGQAYYFELWHKEGIAGSSVAMAWKTPGGSREIVPSQFLRSFVVDAGDRDDDGLADSYELDNGLSITDDGRSAGSNEGYYGDLDGDGLINGEEQKFNSRADLADTDADGVSDYDEANFFGSAVLANSVGAFTPVATLAGDSYTTAFGEWEKFGNRALQKCRRGSVTYPVTVATSGIHALKFAISSIADGTKSEQYEFDVKLNGKRIAYKTIDIAPDGTGTLAILSPWLSAGETYQLELFVDNSYNWRRVSIDSLQVLAAGGIDSNNNGTPDWVDIREHDSNGFDSTAILSKTSPATVEGNARYFDLIQSNGAPVSQAPNGRFFTEVPLTSGTPATLNFAFENGAINQSATVQWLPTNLLQESSITLRQNDSLLLTAFNDAENASLESYTVTANGQTHTCTADQPTPVAFTTPGTTTLELAHTAADGTVTNRTVTVTVLPLVAIESPLCVVGYPRTWTHPALPAGATLQFDDRITHNPETTANTWTLATETPVNQPMLVRQGASGPILGVGGVKHVSVRSHDLTGNILETYGATVSTVRLPVVATGELNDVEIRCKIIVGGVTFADGTTTNSLRINDFDAFGTGNLFFIKANSAHSNCREFSVWFQGVCLAKF